MNQRLTTILLSALLISGGASYLIYQLVGKRLSDNARNRTTKIVVAAKDLEIGAIIKDTDLKTIDLVGSPPKDAILKPETAVGRGVVSAIYSDEPVIERQLAPAGSGGGLAATIPPGMRACAVKVDDVVGVAGFAVPGMRVDVLVSGTLPGDQNSTGTKVRTLLQNIEVLSAGKNFQQNAEGKPVEAQVVNLLVTPDQAETLTLASNQTHIQLVLRNPIDHNIATTSGTDMASVLGKPEPPPAPVKPAVAVRHSPPPLPVVQPAPPPPPPFVVQVMNGGKQTEQQFAPAGGAQ